MPTTPVACPHSGRGQCRAVRQISVLIVNAPRTALDGLPVQRISFEGVPADRLTPLPGHLDQAEGTPLSADNLRRSLRQLYATGLYDSIEVRGIASSRRSSARFRRNPAHVYRHGERGRRQRPTMNTQLERASQLQAGTRFTPAKMLRAVEQMHATLEENGYHEAAITQTVTPHPDQQLADIAFRVVSGPRARVGKDHCHRRLRHEPRRIPPPCASAHRRSCRSRHRQSRPRWRAPRISKAGPA